MRKKIIILGTGGNCIDILDTINEINRISRRKRYECVGFLDDDPSRLGADFHGIKVLGPLSAAHSYDDCYFVNGIGSPYNFWCKEDIIAQTAVPLDYFETIVHPSASISAMSSIGNGTVIFQNVAVTSDVRIGKHVIILPNSVINHHDVIEDYCCVAAGACVSGNVEIDKSCYIGTNSAIKGNVKIGPYCLVGMGSIVLNDVPEGSVVVGSPARFLRNTR